MPIVPHDVSRLHYVGVQNAVYRINGDGTTAVEVPLPGPKRIRQISVITDDNTAAGIVSLLLSPDQTIGGSSVGVVKDIFLPNGSSVVWDESELDPDLVNLDDSFVGFSFAIVAGGAGAWGLQVCITYSPMLDAFRSVCLDPQVSGLL